MTKKSDDRKRKKKLAEKKQKARQAQSLAYLGEKYKKAELVPTLMHAEIGIYQSYILADRKIFDPMVEAAIERLIRQMRSGSLPPLPDDAEPYYEAGLEEDLLIENIRRSWQEHFAHAWQPPRDERIGVLRTILGSIKNMKSAGAHSQSYLRHVATFLTKNLGVSVTKAPANPQPLAAPEENAPARLEHQSNDHP